MTVTTAVSRDEFVGDAVAVAFPTTFGFTANSHLVVTLIVTSTGAQTIQAITTHYTVTGAGAATGTVTMLTAPSALQTLRIERTVPFTQIVNFVTAGPFSPATHTEALDKLTHEAQQLARRCADLEAGASDTTVALAGNGLTKSVDTLHVGAGVGITANADDIAVIYGVAATLADVTKAAENAGVANSAARTDHKHDISTAVAGASAIGDAAAEGTATSLSRSDHVHSVAAPAAPANVTKAAASAGVAVTRARADHKHDITTAAAATITTANAEGTATSLARSDHTHDHGALLGGDRHALAVAATSHGFMSSTDKTKLDGLALETIANSTALLTTDATVTTLLSITPTDETAEFIEFSVIACQVGTATAAGYKITGTFRRNGGTTVQVDATTIVVSDEDTAGWDCVLSVVSPAILLRITGAAATSINWAAVARRVSVTGA